jgi:hypothetical protein
MFHSIFRHAWLPILGLIWFGSTAPLQAQHPTRIRDLRVSFNIEVSSLPTTPQPTAPWYAYFPADPRLMPGPQVTPFPPFPMPFPPKDAPKPAGAAPAPRGPNLTQYWPNYYPYASPSVQTVSYVPSYWYQAR